MPVEIIKLSLGLIEVLYDKNRFLRVLMIAQLGLLYYSITQFLAFIIPNDDETIRAIVLASIMLSVAFIGHYILRNWLSREEKEITWLTISEELLGEIKEVLTAKTKNYIDFLKLENFIKRLILKTKSARKIFEYTIKSFILYLVPYALIYLLLNLILIFLALKHIAGFLVFPSSNLIIVAVSGYILAAVGLTILKKPEGLESPKELCLLVLGSIIIPPVFLTPLKDEFDRTLKIEKREFSLSEDNFKKFLDFLFSDEIKLFNIFNLEEIERTEERKEVLRKSVFGYKTSEKSKVSDSFELFRNAYLILKKTGCSIFLFEYSPEEFLVPKDFDFVEYKGKGTMRFKLKREPMVLIRGFEIGESSVFYEFLNYLREKRYQKP